MRQRAAENADSLPFLLSQVGARTAQLFSDRLEPLGLSPRAFGVLSNVAAAEGQAQQQLADALGIHRNNMVQLIDELEAKGLLRRERSAQDRRAFEIRLTAAGQALVSRVNDVIPAVESELAAGLTDDERAQLIALLGRVASTLGLRPGIHPHLTARRRSAERT